MKRSGVQLFCDHRAHICINELHQGGHEAGFDLNRIKHPVQLLLGDPTYPMEGNYGDLNNYEMQVKSLGIIVSQKSYIRLLWA